MVKLWDMWIISTSMSRRINEELSVMKTALVRITMPHYVCGLIINEDHTVIQAAPIMQWAIGKPIHQVIRWAKNKGGKVG